MSFKKLVFKSGFFIMVFMIFCFFIGEIKVVAIESKSPSFTQKINDITELIPIECSKIILLTNLEREAKQFLNHPIVSDFKKLKLSKEITYSNEWRKITSGIKIFERYTGLKIDLDVAFMKLFGKEGVFCKIEGDNLVIAKLDDMNSFLKQLAKTLSKFNILKRDFITTKYNGISIEELTLSKNKLYFAFIGDYALYTNNKKRIEDIIQFAKGGKYLSINKKLGFNKSIHESKSKKYPVVIYENVRHTKKIENEKGIDRLKHFFSDNYFKVAFSKDKIKIAYQYNYSGRGKIKPLNTIINSKKEKLNLVKGFPKATLLYIATSQLNSNNLYNWFINNWLLNSDERKVFNDTFDQIENNHQVEIRKLVKEEFGNELGVLITGIGYQGYNPFPKLALFVKVSKYAKPIEKMKRIFKYVYNTHTLTETRLHGVSVFYFQSNKRFGYTYSSYTKNTTSDYKEFSPSFAYSNGYMITTFNKSSMSAILYYLKSGKGVSETNSHKLFWQSVTQEYPFQIYISPDRLKQISKTYLNNLNNNEKDEFIYSDANKRLIPFLELLDRVEGIGGGFNFYNDRIEGELIIKLKK